MIGLADYSGRRKQNHRGWAHNRIRERLDVPVDQARGLLLLGPNPKHDIEKACSMGLKRENLIGVDIGASPIAAARREGVYGVQGSLQMVLEGWNGQPLDFIYADTCQHFGFMLPLIGASLCSQAFRLKTVVYVNMQRGRETHDARKLISVMQSDFASSSIIKDDPKHRGRLAVLSLMICWSEQSKQYRVGGMDHIELMNPAFGSYKSDNSNHLTMDSFVAWWPWTRDTMVDWPSSFKILSQSRRGRELLTIRRRLAALKAMRTMAGLAT